MVETSILLQVRTKAWQARMLETRWGCVIHKVSPVSLLTLANPESKWQSVGDKENEMRATD